MNSNLTTNNGERTQAIAWMRKVLVATLEVAPLSYRQKKHTARLLERVPDWLMANCADSLNIDYVVGFRQYPDFAEKATSETGRQLAQQYLEAHDAVPAGFCLDQLGRSVIKHAQGDRLPIDSNVVERQVYALALSECTEDGIEFAGKAMAILSDPENPNHPLVDYQIALERGEKDKLERLNDILTGGRYGEWIDQRLTEAKRYLGLEPPHFTIKHGERTPQWDLLWQRIFTGGDNN